MNPLLIAVITLLGLASAVLIYFAYSKIPQRTGAQRKAEAIHKCLPAFNCGACGYAGCLGYAQALAEKPELANEVTCPLLSRNPEAQACLERALGRKTRSARHLKKTPETELNRKAKKDQR